MDIAVCWIGALQFIVNRVAVLLLTLRKGSRLFKQSAREKFSASPTLSTRPTTGCGAISTSLLVHRTSSSECQETETCIIQACYTPWQPLQNHLSGHLGRWAMPWLAEEMLDGQHRRVDIPAHARTAHKGLLQKRLEEDLCWIAPHVPQQPSWSRDWTHCGEINCPCSFFLNLVSNGIYIHLNSPVWPLPYRLLYVYCRGD